MLTLKNKRFIFGAITLLIVSAAGFGYLYVQKNTTRTQSQNMNESSMNNSTTTPVIVSVASGLNDKNAEKLHEQYENASKNLTTELEKNNIDLAETNKVVRTFCGDSEAIKESVLYSNMVTLLVQEGMEASALVKIIVHIEESLFNKTEAINYMTQELGKEKTTTVVADLCRATQNPVKLEVDAGVVGLVGVGTSTATTTSSISAKQYENTEKVLTPVLAKYDISNEDISTLLTALCKKTVTAEMAHSNTINTVIELKFTSGEISNLFSRISKGDNLSAAFGNINRSADYAGAVKKLCQ